MDDDVFIMKLVASCYDGEWLPHWNLCTSTFFAWMKNPTENKELFIKDLVMDLKRVNLMLELIFEREEEDARQFVESVDELMTQRERLKFILFLVSRNTRQVEDWISYNFASGELFKRKLVLSDQIHETDPLCEKYKQKSIRRVFLKN